MEEIRKGTFDWKIERFLQIKNEPKKSCSFKLWRNDCYLETGTPNEDCYECSEYCPVYLRDIFNSIFSPETILKLSLIDRSGKEFFITSRNVPRIDSDCLLLTSIRDSELYVTQSDRLPGGTLTVRLSWYEERAGAEKNTQTTPNLISDKEPMAMLKTLSNNLSCFYESKVDTDCILNVGNAKFPVHRAVLSARSEVFAAMFHHDTSESRIGVVDIPDVEVNVFNDFLHFVYSGKVRGLTASTAVPLYIAADKYALIELRDICLNFLMHTLTIGNVCETAVLAYNHGEEELEKRVVQFIQDRMEEIQESAEWKKLSTNKPFLVIKLLCSTVMNCKEKIKNVSSK